MFIKLAIIAGILVVGGLIFSSEINTIFPTTSASVTESLKDDVTNLGTKASQSVESRINASIDKVVSKTAEKIDDEITKTKESSKNFLSNELTKINPIESLANIFNEKPNSNLDTDSFPKNDDPIHTQHIGSDVQNFIDKELSLFTTQQSNGNIWLRYYDSTGLTEQVDMTIKTIDREIFLGTFHSSTFETTVKDISLEPYYVDTVVNHKDYGTMTSSLFNSGEQSDSVITGVFSKL